MFERDYCPNCDNYIKALETENDEMRKELQELREAAANVVLYVHDELHQEELDALQAALKQGEE